MINFEFFYDPDDATHQAFVALLLTPVDTNFKVLYADATPHEDIYEGTGFGLDTNMVPTEGLVGSGSIQTSGDPT